MNELTSRELHRTLFEFQLRHYTGQTHSPADLGRVIDTLARTVLDLMMEVEALREAQVAGSSYRDAYREIGLLTHNCGGPSDGFQKLMLSYYPEHADEAGRAWRETLMLRRMGASKDEIEAYRRDARGMEALS